MPSSDRLLAALRRIEDALASQARAVAAWRDALDGLAGAQADLERSAIGYGAVLGRLRADVLDLGRQARALERTMDAAARGAAPPPLAALPARRPARLAA